MDLEQFIRPSASKLIPLAGLFLVSGFVTYVLTLFMYDVNPAYGFPLHFLFFGGPTMSGLQQSQGVDFAFLVIDGVFWYLTSCLVFKRKKRVLKGSAVASQ